MVSGAARTQRSLSLAAAALAASVFLLAAGAAAQQPGHTPPASTARTPLYTEDELRFLTHMIVHHEQALDMAALVPSRSKREEFIRFARYVDGGQRVEIDQMKALLRFAAERGQEIPHHEMHGDPPMQGMLSTAQMAALAAASGADFERLWLQGMIYHHEGAMVMGRALQEQEFATGRQPYGLDVLVDDIVVVQRGEITKMKNWLVQWGLVSDAKGADTEH